MSRFHFFRPSTLCRFLRIAKRSGAEGTGSFVASVFCFLSRLPLHKTQNHSDQKEPWGAFEGHYHTLHHFNFPHHFSIAFSFSWPRPSNRIKQPPHISMQQCQESVLSAITHQGLLFYYFSCCLSLFFFPSCLPRSHIRNERRDEVGKWFCKVVLFVWETRGTVVLRRCCFFILFVVIPVDQRRCLWGRE